MADADLIVSINGEMDGLSKTLKQSEKSLDKFNNQVNKDLKETGDSFNKFGKNVNNALKGLIAFAALDRLSALTKQVLEVTAEFEKFGAVLTNTLGSKALADLKIAEIQEFAAKTPFGVKELTDSFVKLANQGFKPTGNEMRALGDLAASTGKSFDQLAEAILDAQVGEFERLKEFGIRAQDAGDKVIFTFKGVQTTVDKSSTAIRDYITALGDAEGVSGSMAAISQTLTGQISNLGDAWDQLLISIGSNTKGVFATAISLLTESVNKLTDFNRQLEIGSKFNLKGQGTTLLQLLNPFKKLAGETSFEKQSRAFLELEKRLNSENAEIINGAKFVKQFDDRLTELAKSARSALLGKQDEGVIRGITQTYLQAVQQIQDARAKFIEERNKPLDQGFGTPKKTETPTIQNKITDFSDARSFMLGIEEIEKANIKTPKIDTTSLTKALADIRKFNEESKKSLIDITDFVNTSLSAGFASFGESLGSALANGDNLLEAFGQSVLSTIGDVLIQFGKLTIAAGVAALGLFEALTSPTPANAAAAILAGTALVAVGAAVKAFSSNISKNGVSGGGNTQQSNPKSIPQFAGGVTGFSGGLALVGERGPELVTMGRDSNVITNENIGRFMTRREPIIQLVGTVGISMGEFVVGIERQQKFNKRNT